MSIFDNKIVKKPWGEEYLLFENNNVAIWHLLIKKGESTSFHAHPNKKTGLVVIKGGAELSFLSDKFKLFPAEKCIIRHGVFHKTRAVVENVELLEIETPNNKLDLVRLEDNYGRKGQPYEDSKSYKNIETRKLVLNLGTKFGDCGVKYFQISNSEQLNNTVYKTFMIVEGNITCGNFSVAGPGDVLYKQNLQLMIDKFGFYPLYVVAIC